MSIIDRYEKAYQRIEQEKVADYLVQRYGTSEGYLPKGYAGAYVELEKEAHIQNIVDTFAPETQYIPSHYVEALEKQAFITALGKSMASAGGKGLGKMIGSGAVKQTGKEGIKSMQLAQGAGLKDTAKFYGNKALAGAGSFMKKNPNLVGGGLAAGAGLGAAGYMMGKNQNNG